MVCAPAGRAVRPSGSSGPLFAHFASGSRPRRFASVLRPLRRGAPAAASRARSGVFALASLPAPAPLGLRPLLQSCRPCARCRAPWSAAPRQFLRPFSGCLRAPCSVALAASARPLGSLPGSQLPLGLARFAASGAAWLQPGAVGGLWPPFFGLPAPGFLLACCARCAFYAPRRKRPRVFGCAGYPAFSPAPLPSPPPPLGAPGKREAVPQGLRPPPAARAAPPGLIRFLRSTLAFLRLYLAFGTRCRLTQRRRRPQG